MDRYGFWGLLRDGPLLTDGIEAIHRRFLAAGAGLILTNTFGANRFRLGRRGAAPEGARRDAVDAINRAGVEIARRAGAGLVAGSMGPLGVRLAPYGRVRPEDAFDAYREQAVALSGADLIIIETQSDLREMEQALAAVREAAPHLAVVVSATFSRDDRTLLGSTPSQVAAALVALEPDGIGVNCGEGPTQALRVIRAMTPLTGDLPLLARPNAGGPVEVGGRIVYPATPPYMADLARALLDVGVAVVGGCCGTGPAHIAAMAEVFANRVDRHGQVAPDVDLVASEPAAAAIEVSIVDEGRDTTNQESEPTELQRKLARGEPVVAVELEPPRSFNAATLVAAAVTLREAGADVIDVADSPMAKMRMSAWAACRLVQEQAGIETVLHFPTRGRNVLRLQGDLLGAHALGIRNLFVCVGDPVTVGDYPHGSNNVDVTATGLLELVTSDLNHGRDQAGSSIGEPTAFFAGAAVSPGAQDLEREVRLLRRKVTSGAAFLLSQPLYTIEPLLRLRQTYERLTGESLHVPLLAGVLPLVSARHAEFLHNEVPGVQVPEDIRNRLRSAGSQGASEQGREIATELVADLWGADIAGLYVMPQFGRYDLAADIVERIRTIIA
jgi:homocysteine S-methyltransferase